MPRKEYVPILGDDAVARFKRSRKHENGTLRENATKEKPRRKRSRKPNWKRNSGNKGRSRSYRPATGGPKTAPRLPRPNVRS